MSKAIATTNPFKVGDILYANVGYTMGIPEWVEVTRVTATRVYGKYLKHYNVTDDGYGQNGTRMPLLGQYDEETFDGKVHYYQYQWMKEPEVSVKEKGRYGSHFDLWDGKPKAFYTD